jgi:hypothetical protein
MIESGSGKDKHACMAGKAVPGNSLKTRKMLHISCLFIRNRLANPNGDPSCRKWKGLVFHKG